MRSARLRVTLLAGALVTWLGVPEGAQAQQSATITGRVTTDAGVPLPGANVLINEMTISVGTNANGIYTIVIPAARVNRQTVQLRVRSVGFTPSSRAITITPGSQTANFELRTDVLRLNEVVVTGVAEGTERAKVPFAIGRVTAADLPVPATDPMRALQGKVAGLRIAQTSGRPGANPEIQLRGPTSINATGRTNGPLIIVDGVIMNVGSLNEIGGLDIESVEVVKGAAGASLYGTRAANGVITITTKRGSGDGVRFNARTEYGINDLNSINYGMPVNHQLQLDETGTRFCVSGSTNLAPCSRTLDWTREIMRINNVNADTTRAPQSVQWNALTVGGGELLNVFQSQLWPGQYYNPLAQVLRRNPTSINQLDASGRAGSVRFYSAGSFVNEAGAIRGLNGNQQRRVRLNLDYDARRDLNIQFSTLYNNGTDDLRNGGSSAGSIFGQILRGISIGTSMLARDTLGRYLIRSGGANLRSPTGNGAGTLLYDSENFFARRRTGRYVASMTTRYTPADWATVEGSLAYDNRQQNNKAYSVKGYRTNTISPGDNFGNIAFGNRNEQSMNGSVTATLRRDQFLLDDLNAKLTFRALADQNTWRADSSRAEQFVVSDVFRAENATQNKNATSSEQTIKNVGYVTGATFDFKDRYTVDGYFRYDGSSLFGAGNRYAPYGRVSGVWQFSKEPFWNVGFMSDARLRASYGTAGTPPRFVAQYETYTISATGVALGQAGNSQLRPEVTAEAEAGLDFTLFGRLGIEATHARGRTKNQILPVNTPAALGFNTQWKNAGTLINRTWELAANLPILQRRDLQWSMRGSWDRTRTFIDELFVPDFVMDAGTAQGTASLFRVTASREKSNGFAQNRLGNIWGRKFYTSCGQLPQAVQGQCGEGRAFQRNDQGYIVWVGQGNSWRDGITKNLWGTYLPIAQSPWNFPLQYGHPIVDRPLRGEPGEGVGRNQVLGNALPDFRVQFSNNLTYKRLTAYILFDGTFGQEIYNQGEAWGLLDLSSSNFDQARRTVETAKPVGYSWRAGHTEGAGTGGFYDQLGPNNYNVEDASFVKAREVSLTYNVGRIRGVGDWTVGLIGRNLFTITGYSGLDPEVGSTGGSTTNGTGSGLLNQVDAFGFPTLRTFTFSVATRF